MSANPAEVVFQNFNRRKASSVINENASDELIFAVVGPVGSGTTFVAQRLSSLVSAYFKLDPSNVKTIKATTVIEQEMLKTGKSISTQDKLIRAKSLQDAGDELRSHDHAAIATLLVGAIKSTRQEVEASQKSSVAQIGQASEIKGIKKVFILDSLKLELDLPRFYGLFRGS